MKHLHEIYWLKVFYKNNSLRYHMCGIFGYSDCENKKTQEEICNVVVQGLEAVEYRGYDSAGACIFDNGKLVIYKKAVGKVEKLKAELEKINEKEGSKTGSFIGIAHTRWATHGPACEKNAHPVRSDPEGTFFVVHNGIITNYKEKKEYLESKGHKFETDTDTEVASKLIFQFYKENSNESFKNLAEMTVKACNGQSAFLFLSSKFPNEMIAIHNGLPMILGVQNAKSALEHNSKENTYSLKAEPNTKFIVSSDVSSIVKHTDTAIWANTGTLMHITKEGLKIHFYKEQKLEPVLAKIEVTAQGCDKGQFAHYMLKEIHEQKESILNATRNRVDFSKATINLESLKKCRDAFLNANRFLFVACGTSYHSCLAVMKVFESLNKKPVSVSISSHFLDLEPHIDAKDVVFFISQSGETADSLRALEYCEEKGATTVGITNTPGSTIDRKTSCSMNLQAGIEKGVASTKAYTSQFMCLILAALYISQESNTSEQLRKEIIHEIQDIPDKIDRCLTLDIDSYVDEILFKQSLLIVSRGHQAATCLEGSLKIKEISYIHAEGILAGELKHGPLALVSPELSVIAVIVNDEFFDKSHNALEQIEARGSQPLVICTDDIMSKYKKYIAVPKTHNCLQGILTVIPFQLISYKVAVKRGIDPDFPRNLAKSVTVE